MALAGAAEDVAARGKPQIHAVLLHFKPHGGATAEMRPLSQQQPSKLAAGKAVQYWRNFTSSVSSSRTSLVRSNPSAPAAMAMGGMPYGSVRSAEAPKAPAGPPGHRPKSSTRVAEGSVVHGGYQLIDAGGAGLDVGKAHGMVGGAQATGGLGRRREVFCRFQPERRMARRRAWLSSSSSPG